MLGWVLNKFPRHAILPSAYGINRLLSEAVVREIPLTVVSPKELEVVINHHGQPVFYLNGVCVPPPDFVLNRLGSASSYFVIICMRQLEIAGCYLPNSAASVELARDKMRSLLELVRVGLPVAKTMLAQYPTDVERVASGIGFPLVVKTLAGSQGRGVFLCETRERFEDLIGMITTSKGIPNFVVQEFVAGSYGRDLRAFVIGNKVVACMLRQAASGHFKANYSAGATVSLYPLDPLIERLALKTARTLGLEIAGVDLLFDGDGYKVCEANSSPGFKGMEECCGQNIAGEILSHLVSRVKSRKNDFSPLLPI